MNRRLLRRLADVLHRLDPDPRRAERRWWAQRVRRLGTGAVYHHGHRPEDRPAVDRKQKAILYPALERHLRGDERVVLDFGCGAGRFTPDLARLVGGTAIGVDPMPALLDAAPRADNVTYRLVQNGRVPLDDDSVDVVWVCLVLMCIPDARALHKAVAEIRRVLRPGGLLFLAENTATKPGQRHIAFRSVAAYQALFPFAPLEHVCDYDDLGERISVMAGRKHGGPDA